jgi:lipopolysaccharide/colanic/teichoic acid biosynthesis glycosyltransferase
MAQFAGSQGRPESWVETEQQKFWFPLVRGGERWAPVASAALKRVLDIAVSALLLLLLLVPFALVALLILWDSPGPIFYRAERVGVGWSPLTMFKFRTMRHGAKGPRLTVDEDPRFTRVGKILSSTKVDELPQLWNVLRGQMSLIGPRPQSPEFAERFRDEYDSILIVRPGMTGLTQVAFANENGVLKEQDRVQYYLEVLLPQKLEIDLMYVERRSVQLDARIAFWTAVATLTPREVAVHRGTGKMKVRNRPPLEMPAPIAEQSPELELELAQA